MWEQHKLCPKDIEKSNNPSIFFSRSRLERDSAYKEKAICKHQWSVAWREPSDRRQAPFYLCLVPESSRLAGTKGSEGRWDKDCDRNLLEAAFWGYLHSSVEMDVRCFNSVQPLSKRSKRNIFEIFEMQKSNFAEWGDWLGVLLSWHLRSLTSACFFNRSPIMYAKLNQICYVLSFVLLSLELNFYRNLEANIGLPNDSRKKEDYAE